MQLHKHFSFYSDTLHIAIRVLFSIGMQSIIAKERFLRDWQKGQPPRSTDTIVIPIENERLQERWSNYVSTLPSHYRHIEQHYHGTTLTCNLNNYYCWDNNCAICRIASNGFDPWKISTDRFQRFGRGFYLSPVSSKCHDYTRGAYGFRAMLLCDVCVGRKYPLDINHQHLNGPPQGYHSIHGQVGKELNYKEIVLAETASAAILPRYIILYRKDGEHRIA